MTAMKATLLVLASAALAALLSACTVRKAEAPALTGPSEYGLSVSVTASPDTVTQDGQSSSLITIVARDSNGQPRPNTPLRLDILLEGAPVDAPALAGTLSARNVVTGQDGRATSVYTPPVVSVRGECGNVSPVVLDGCVRIAVTSVNTGIEAAVSQSVQIRLLPKDGSGGIPPQSATPAPNFTIAPALPAANALVQFDASQSCAGGLVLGVCPANAGRITNYSWSFGDGGSGSGQLTSYRYQVAGTYLVSLTVTNDRGVTSQPFTRSITVGAGSLPTAGFLFSPTPVQLGIPVNFDAGLSRPATGHRIVEYKWNWGDGQPVESGGNSTLRSHTFTSAGVFTVVLTVVDDAGQTGLASQAITVTAGPGATPPTAAFLFSPTPVSAGSAVHFNAIGSRAATGRTLVRYEWNWGDGSGVEQSANPLRDHTFGTPGAYSVVLTVYDDTGLPGSTSQTVTVGGAPGGVPPTSDFVFSPTPVQTNASVFFDASASKAGAGHTVVRYDWNWGDGSPIDSGASPLRSHVYTAAAVYTVVLTVFDEINQSALSTKTVTVGEAPTGAFRSSPTNPIIGQVVNFDASESRGAIGRTIVKYEWNWGDGTQSGPLTSPLAGHTYTTGQTFVVILTVTDDIGLTDIFTANVVVAAP